MHELPVRRVSMPKQSSDSDPIPGEFGYRTTHEYGAGLDPIQQKIAFARAEGVFIRDLLSGNVRSCTSIYVFLLVFLIMILLFITNLILSNPANVLPFVIFLGFLGSGFFITY